MAVGLAKMLGFDLILNFRQPYFSPSIKGFWSSWHISLSTWLKDYIYIPLGGNRRGKLRRNINLFITFLISGLWHGANWTYVLWGAVHGLAQVIENTVYEKTAAGRPPMPGKQDGKNKVLYFVQVCITFAVVTLAWIFFRANSISDAFYAITHLLQPGILSGTLPALGLVPRSLVKVLVMIAGLWLFDLFSKRCDPILFLRKQKLPLRWAVYLVFAVLVIVLKLHGGAKADFIYFQF